MTTIAYKNGVIAYDSYATSGGVIVNHNAEKKVVVKDVIFFIAGAISDINKFIDSYFGAEPEKNIDLVAFVIDGENLFLASVDSETGFWKHAVEKNNHRAIGSGGDFALTAMDMGADAVKAVEMAIHRDIYSGGEIKTHKVGF